MNVVSTLDISVKSFVHARPYGARIIWQWHHGEELLCQSLLRVKDGDRMGSLMLTLFLESEKKRAKEIQRLLSNAQYTNEDSQCSPQTSPTFNTQDLDLYLSSQSDEL